MIASEIYEQHKHNSIVETFLRLRTKPSLVHRTHHHCRAYIIGFWHNNLEDILKKLSGIPIKIKIFKPVTPLADAPARNIIDFVRAHPFVNS